MALPDGRVVTVETDDPQAAAAAAHAFQTANPMRNVTPAGPPRRYTAENFRTGRSPTGGRDIPVPEPLIPLAMKAQDIAGGIGDFTQQIVRSLGIGDEIDAGANAGRQALHNALTGDARQSPAQAATEAAQETNAQQADYARQHPNLNTLATVAGVPATAGTPVATGPISAIKAGLTAAGIDAPFALARQEGDLQERLPGAAQEVATTGLFGAGLTALGNRLAPLILPRAASRAGQFERAGVRPTMAAINGGTSAGVTKMIGENFVGGAGVRARLQGSLDDTATSARNLAEQYGQHESPENVGEAVQGAIRNFARGGEIPPNVRVNPAAIPSRDLGFGTKANALYDHVFERIGADEAAHIAGQTGATVTTDATQAAIRQIQGRVTAPAVGELVQSPLVGRIGQALEADHGALRFQDLRQLRTWVREARADPQLRMNTSEADLARLEGALTQDIYSSAREIGGDYAEGMLRRADRFYGAGMRRINDVLRPFTNASPRGAYDRIISLAREGGRQNSRALNSALNSLPTDLRRQVAATVIDNLGRVSAGHPEALQQGAFSVDRFVTEYARLSPEGRQALFGGAGREALRDSLDNLAQVAGYQKGVEAMANRSRSGVNVQNVGTGMGLLNPGTSVPTMATLGGMMLTGEALTNPAFVRWLTSASRSAASVGGIRRQLSMLSRLAARDPALSPIYSDLAGRANERFQNRQDTRQRTLEPAQ